MKMLQGVTVLLLSAAVAACATDGLDRQDMKTKITIEYGTIKNMEKVQLKSDVGKNAAIGGLWGLAAGSGGNRGDMAGGALVGAALMGLTTKIAEGSNEAMSYTLAMSGTQQELKVVTDDQHAQIGDCVSVETGRTTNLRRVEQSMCQPPTQHPVEQEIHAAHLQDATECDEAKQELLKAKSDADINAGIKKVKVLCH